VLARRRLASIRSRMAICRISLRNRNRSAPPQPPATPHDLHAQPLPFSKNIVLRQACRHDDGKRCRWR
jgi:hypothetical protein